MSRKHIVEQYERLIQTAPRWYLDVNELLDVYEYYEDEGRLADADLCLRYALQLHPDDEMLLVKQAYALRSNGRVGEATALIDRLNPVLLEVRFFKAEEALAAFRLDEAGRIFRDILVESVGPTPGDGADWGLHLDVAECYAEEGLWREALHILAPVPSDAPDARNVRLLRAECLCNLNDIPSAVEEVNAAIDLDPYAVEAWGMLAELQYETQHYVEAQESAQYALAVDAGDEKALRISFFAHIAQAQRSEALAVARQYVALWPDEYYLPMHAGQLCLTLNNTDEALTFLRRANATCPAGNPDRNHILALAARLQAMKGDCEESFRTLLRTCSRTNPYDMVCVQMAALAVESGNAPFACQRLEEVSGHITPQNGQLVASVMSLLSTYPALYAACPSTASALRRINTSVS